jgi:hypothetical protein
MFNSKDLKRSHNELSEVSTLKASFAEFKRHLSIAEDHYRVGNLEAAAVYASFAANIATIEHCGFFVSPSLEKLLTKIGRKLVDPIIPLTPQPRSKSYRRVLHVCTEIYPIGGHSTMLRRWMQADNTRIHSLVLTHQRRALPDDLSAAVAQNGGCIHRPLNMRIGGFLSRVKALRKIALQNDVIVLHVGNGDVIPSIAFANTEYYPPVLYLNHADHMFWLGSSIAHLVLSMRQAAMDICELRRSIERRRNVLLPILVDWTIRKAERTDAKSELGLNPNCILLTSVARGVKYRNVGAVTYADVHVPILTKYPQAVLIAVGPGDREDWAKASNAVGGRIRSVPEQNPKLYFEAADIYLDSYPFCSATSMMEAGGYELPCVSRFLHPPAARICGMDHPGLVGPLIEARSDDEYVNQLSQLIEDRSYRAKIGAAIHKSVYQANVAPHWCDFLEAAYSQAIETPRVDNKEMFPAQLEQCHLGEPDIRLQRLYGFRLNSLYLLKSCLPDLPFLERLARWNDVRQERGFHSKKDALKHLVPNWLTVPHAIRRR